MCGVLVVPGCCKTVAKSSTNVSSFSSSLLTLGCFYIWVEWVLGTFSGFWLLSIRNGRLIDLKINFELNVSFFSVQ